MAMLWGGPFDALDWITLAVLVAALLYLYLTWTFSHWEKHGIPFVKPVPFFGCMKSSVLARRTIGEDYVDFYRQLSGHRYGGFFKFRQPSVLLRDPELIKTVLVKDFPSFHDNDFQVDEKVDPMLGRNPFVLTGEKWKAVRSQLTPAFTAGKVKPLFPLMMEVSKELTSYLEKEPSAQTPDGLEAKELSAKFTTDVVASCVFGLHGNSFQDPNADFRRMGRLIFSLDIWMGIQHACIILAPKVADFLKFKFISNEVANFFRKMVEEVTSYREKNNVKRNDFMQLLIQMKNKEPDADSEYGRYTNEDLAAHATLFFTDGFETSSTVLGFTLYEMAMNLDIQERLREEVDSVMQENGELSYETLHGMKLLDMVISESMRKHPPVMFLNRLCTKPFSLPTPAGGSYTVQVGTPVVIPVTAIQRDPEHYPEPERFDPERFTEENKQRRHKYTYLPFGEGPRICLGTRFAVTQTKVGLAALVSQFHIQPCRKTCSVVKPHPNFFLLASKDGLWLNFVRRANK